MFSNININNEEVHLISKVKNCCYEKQQNKNSVETIYVEENLHIVIIIIFIVLTF
jgi:hypothetical protein